MTNEPFAPVKLDEIALNRVASNSGFINVNAAAPGQHFSLYGNLSTDPQYAWLSLDHQQRSPEGYETAFRKVKLGRGEIEVVGYVHGNQREEMKRIPKAIYKTTAKDEPMLTEIFHASRRAMIDGEVSDADIKQLDNIRQNMAKFIVNDGKLDDWERSEIIKRAKKIAPENKPNVIRS